MPFDATELTPTIRRALLLDGLRDMPKTHRWSFSTIWAKEDCGTAGCAMGLGHALGLWDDKMILEWGATDLCAKALDCEPETIRVILSPKNNVFLGAIEGPFAGIRFRDITPKMVADALEEAFANAPT